MKFVSTREACKILGVHANTLRNWDREGKIKTIRTPNGTRLYDVNSILKKEGRKVIYARVSSRNQKSDLSNQIKYLRERYPDYELIQDVGSGLNFKRKGFQSLLESILSGDISEIVVTHKDRLCRFGFELIEYIAAKNNCKIVVCNEHSLSPREELIKDLISIIHVFSCRIYGLRKYASQVSKDKNLSKELAISEKVSGAEQVLVQQSR